MSVCLSMTILPKVLPSSADMPQGFTEGKTMEVYIISIIVHTQKQLGVSSRVACAMRLLPSCIR